MASHLMLQRCLAAAPLTSETSPPRRRRLRRMAVDQPPQGSVGGLNCGPLSRTCAVCASHVCRTERCCRCHWLAEAATRRCAPSHILLAAFSTRLAPRCTADLHSPCHALCVGRGHHWTQCKCVACEDLAQIRHALLQRAPRLPCHQPSSHVQLRHMAPQLRYHLSPSCRRCRYFDPSWHGASPYGSTATSSDAVPRCCTVRSRSASIAARTHVAIRVRIRQPSVTPRLACLPLPRDTTPAGRPHPASHREQEQGWRRRHNSTRSCYQTVATQHEHSCHVTAALRQTVKGPAAYTRIRPTGRTVQVSPHDLCKRRVAQSARTYPRIRRCNQPSALWVMSA